MNDLAEALEHLTERIDALERRIAAIEQPSRPQPIAPELTAAPFRGADLPRAALSPGSGVFSILGKAMLGIAGAYALRALAESSAIPHTPVIVVAIAYAFVWLLPATRSRRESWFVSLAWAVTSAVILVPMLWELTLRFGLLPDLFSAGILALYVVAASAFGWKHNFQAVSWISDSAASLAALVLAIATRNPVPFVGALLIMLIAGEIAAARGRGAQVRFFVAAAADLALFAAIWIYAGPAASRVEYHPAPTALLLALAPALLFIHAISATVQTLLQRRAISVFETTQALIALLLSIWTVLVFWSGPGAALLGGLCIIGSAAGYLLTFVRFDRTHATRNYHVYATGSFVLFLAGCFLSLHSSALPFCLALFAIAATVLGARASRRTLEMHGLIALCAAGTASGMFVWDLHTIAGSFPAAPSWILLVVSSATILAYSALVRFRSKHWWPQSLRLFSGLLAFTSAASLILWMLVRVTAGVTPAAERLAVIRTLTVCSFALALAWSGGRWQHREQVSLAWAAVAFVAFKLLFEDLRHGRLEFTAASIFCFAVTLLLVPRLLRDRTQRPDVPPLSE